MKYHINQNGEVKPCYAKNRCRFGGLTGHDNHFKDLQEAEEKAQEILKSQYEHKSMRKNNNKLSSLQKLADQGITINRIKNIENDTLNKIDFNNSEIDIVEDPINKDFLTSIRKGRYNFTK